MRFPIRVVAAFVVAFLWLWPMQAGAGFAGLTHSSWTGKDGVPAMVQALAQTPDGYLWLGTGDGLYRFDGVTFERILPAPDHPRGAMPVTSLLVTRAGELWVGFSGSGGIEVYRGGRMQRAGMPRPPGEITELREDLDGGIWAVGGRGRNALKRLLRGKWSWINHKWGVPRDEAVSSLLVARDGTIWIVTEAQVLFLRRGAARFEPTGRKVVDGGTLAQDARGEIWLSDPTGTRMLADFPAGATAPKNLVFYPAANAIRRVSVLFDRNGTLWGTTFTGGLFQIASPGEGAPVATFHTGDGLTSNQAVALLQDREQNIWIATELGLDQFRASKVESMDVPAKGSATGYRMIADERGDVFLLSGSTLYRAKSGAEVRPIRHGLAGAVVLCRGRAGSIWVVESGKATRLRGGKLVQTLPLPDNFKNFACGEDGRGRFWIARFARGLLLHEGNSWREIPLPTGTLGKAQDVVIDREGRPIFILDRRRLLRLDGTQATVWSSEQIGVAGFTMVYDGPDGLLVGGGTGLARWNGHGFDRLSIDRHPWLRGIRGIVQTAGGQTWAINNVGILHLASADLDAGFANPLRPIPHDLFNEQDGLASRTQGLDGIQMEAGGDGRLWFLMRQGVVRVDPARLASNRLPPPVMVRALVTGGMRYPDPSALDLPQGTRNLSIEYTGLSLSVPSRVRFRYRLDGVDTDWVDPGTRRQAFYTNLAPGHYRFFVQASNDAGVWNRTGATLTFEIPPAFTQTRLFYVLCALAFAGLLWLLFQLRLRSLSARLRSRLGERLSERERIARELHDTLLQGVQAVMLRFQLVADDLPADIPVRQALEEALDRADNVLAEGRERVQDLRLAGGGGDIAELLLELAHKQGFDGSTEIRIASAGEPRELDPLVWDEVVRITAEALCNVMRHAAATRVDIEIEFQAMIFRIAVQDDGSGIPADVIEYGRSGHFGLIGMRERAREIGADLVIANRVPRGTAVILAIPARTAYLGRRKRRGQSAKGSEHG